MLRAHAQKLDPRESIAFLLADEVATARQIENH
jgi:hypothetical protein